MITHINDDCFNYMPVLANESVDLILSDMPYGTTKNNWDKAIDLAALWNEYNRIIKQNGAIVLFSQSPFDKILACSNMKNFRYEWIWEKTTGSGHLNSKRMPLKCHENILVFYKKMPTYNPVMTSGHNRKIVSSSHQKNSIKSLNYGSQINTSYDSTERFPRDVILMPTDRQKSKLHPTQKPVSLLSYLVRTYTNKGETVLDNFSGSGSVGVACHQTDRNCILIEKDTSFFNAAQNRINNL